MTIVEQLGKFIEDASYSDLSDTAVENLKKRLLDSLACAFGATAGEPIKKVGFIMNEFGGNPMATFINGNKAPVHHAAFMNGALIRYLDFNDSFLAKGETCHPSDNIGAVLAASEYVNASGKEFLTALAIAYQIQCRLSEETPVRDKGFDHTVQGNYAAAASVSKAMGLSADKIANAISIAATANNALRVTRTGSLSHWKGLAYASTAFNGSFASFLAREGITGPEEIFEGNKGFFDSIAGEADLDWLNEDLEKVNDTILKKYNAEIHSQSSLEALLELKDENNIKAEDIDSIEVEIFDVAYNIIGGGEEGAKMDVSTKEEADHSLFYLLSVAMVDGQVMPEQYKKEKIERREVQSLMKKIDIKPHEKYSRQFPDLVPVKIKITTKDGNEYDIEKEDYEGFTSRPASWEMIESKFEKLAGERVKEEKKKKIIKLVKELDQRNITELTSLFD